MADPSFDVVSKVDRQEVDNALNQARRSSRSASTSGAPARAIAWAGEEAVTIESETEERARAAVEVFKEKLIKRGHLAEGVRGRRARRRRARPTRSAARSSRGSRRTRPRRSAR